VLGREFLPPFSSASPASASREKSTRRSNVRVPPIADINNLADDRTVTLLFAIALAAASSAPADHPKTFLASIEGIPLGPNESMDEFQVETWGVEFKAVCHIPGGWWIEAGGSATPEGSLKGRGSLGATWLNRKSLSELRNLVLLTLYAPVQREDIRDRTGDAIIPATFKGRASVYGPKGRVIPLTYANVRLVPAQRCPS
jgi:hypothetical protein